MTLKLKGDLDILKMYLHTKNEVSRLKHSKFPMVDEICMVNEKNAQTAVKVEDQGHVTHWHAGNLLWL